MNILCIDFETKDPYISLGLGAGWVYALNNPNSLFKALGASICHIREGKVLNSQYFTVLDAAVNIDFIKEQIESSDILVMHNAQYDIGCLLTIGIDVSHKKILDTKIIAKLINPLEFSFSLEPLCEKYLPLEDGKGANSMVDEVVASGLVDDLKPKKADYNEINFKNRVRKWCYSNMETIQEKAFHIIEKYANQDTQATAKLLLHQLKSIGLDQALYWSSYQHICVALRKKGLAIDIHSLKSGMEKIGIEVEVAKKRALDLLGVYDCNLDSPTQVSRALKAKGIKLPKGNTFNSFKTDKQTLEKLADKEVEEAKAILAYREVSKLYNDFFVKILDMQQYTCPSALVEGAKYGRVFPEYNLFGAATGRFSSSNPNIQQIPKRNKVWGPVIRSIYVPDNENNNWYSLDWANQEGRLQVHFAALVGSPKADEVVTEFQTNPALDLHQKVADMAGITRNQAKPINLGLSYGMGQAKLARSLGLPTEWIKWKGRNVEVAGPDGKAILDLYHRGAPFIKDLSDKVNYKLNNTGYITTINGRRLPKDPLRSYLGLSKLIQGSAADQMLMALKEAYDAGLDIKCVVHDEFNIEGNVEDAKKMQQIMENVLQLKVPMIAEIQCGKNWGTLGEL